MIVVDGKEVSVDRWCREFGEGDKLLAVLISYIVIFLIAAILLYIDLKKRLH